jgi:hypothetical protein
MTPGQALESATIKSSAAKGAAVAIHSAKASKLGAVGRAASHDRTRFERMERRDIVDLLSERNE